MVFGTSTEKKYIIKFKIQIIKIEDLEKMNVLSKKIDLDMSIKKNHTQSIKTPALTPETIKIINKIYYNDFILFGYKKAFELDILLAMTSLKKILFLAILFLTVR